MEIKVDATSADIEKSGNSSSNQKLPAVICKPQSPATSSSIDFLNRQWKTEHPYGFPYSPYSIQMQLMTKLEQTLEQKQIGLFSSPTGTGKSLSVICSTFYWLVQHRKQLEHSLSDRIAQAEKLLNKLQLESETSDDWLIVQGKMLETKNQFDELRSQKEELDAYRKRSDDLQRRAKKNQGIRIHKQRQYSIGKQQKRKAMNVIEDEQNVKKAASNQDEDEEQLLLVNDEKPFDDTDNMLNEGMQQKAVKQVKPKLIYASRTHSQLSQFVGEIGKTVYKDQLRLATIGSRNNLCINPDVQRIRSNAMMNDKCMELNSSSRKCSYYKKSEILELRDDILSQIMDIEEAHQAGKDACCCPYYAERFSIDEADVILLPYNILLNEKARATYNLDLNDNIVVIDEAHNLRDTIASTHSIEITGNQVLLCQQQLTFYMNRYNSRLSALSMKNLKQLKMIMDQLLSLMTYKPSSGEGEKSQKEQAAKSARFTKEEITRLNSEGYFINFEATAEQPCLHLMMHVPDFLSKSCLDDLNLHSLINFCEQTQIARKLFGFSAVVARKQLRLGEKMTDSEKSENKKNQASGTSAFLAKLAQQKAATKKSSTKASKAIDAKVANPPVKSASTEHEIEFPMEPTSPLYQILEILRAISQPSADGRLLLKVHHERPKLSSLKYLLLNVSSRFESIVAQARSVILIGGTMEPVIEFTKFLIEPINHAKKAIVRFSCGHVIPDSNLLVVSVANGPSGKPFRFNHNSRNNKEMIVEAGRLLLNLCGQVPGGLVAFFSSYAYANQVYQIWMQEKLIEAMEKRGKRVFREPRNANDVAKTLTTYGERIRRCQMNKEPGTGAVLLSVVGGKMSEGINFNDDLARCVLVFGLPYSNPADPELKEKINYLSASQKQDSAAGADEDVWVYYQGLCGKAVNQSIGRAIRHANDYAAIWLIDERYVQVGENARHQIDFRLQLSSWIRDKLKCHVSFGTAFKDTVLFFKNKLPNRTK